MSCYFVARIRIADEGEYQRYLDRADEVFARYGGEYLAVDDEPVALEGERQSGRAVLIRFPDEDSFREWYDSPEYQELLQLRLSAAVCEASLVRGK